MFENGVINGIYYSRFISSFAEAGGDIRDRDLLRGWLEHLSLEDDDIYNILELATSGKLELEMDAKHWLKQNKNNY